MHENILQWDPFSGHYWWHRWRNGEAPVVPAFVSKFTVWRPTQQRARDGTVARHRTGGLKKTS